MARYAFKRNWHSSIKPPPPGPGGAVVQVYYSDDSMPALSLCVSSNNVWTWYAAARTLREGKWVPTRHKIGRAYHPKMNPGGVTLPDARTQAQQILDQCKAGDDPTRIRAEKAAELVEHSASTFDAIAARFIDEYAKRKKKNRSWPETARTLGVPYREAAGGEGMREEPGYFPEWKGKPIGDIRRLDVSRALGRIAKDNGPVMADRALAAVRKMFNWYAAQDDRFETPIVKGMAVTSSKSRARDRVLSDAEIRAFWKATETAGVYGRVARFLLLTAKRRSEAGKARWDEIDGDLWAVPVERSKTKTPIVTPLTPAAIAVLPAKPDRIGPFCFQARTGKPFNGYSKAKRELDAAMHKALRETDPQATLAPWRINDLRHTAKTLMARRRVPREYSERVLAHAIPGVEGVYDQHHYVPEKRQALEVLAAEIHRIINPTPGNVVEFPSVHTGT